MRRQLDDVRSLEREAPAVPAITSPTTELPVESAVAELRSDPVTSNGVRLTSGRSDAQPNPQVALKPEVGVPPVLRQLAEQYRLLRENMPSGGERTMAMTRVVNAMRAVPVSADLMQLLLASGDAGERLAAVVHLQDSCDAETVGWLGARLWLDKPFIGYQAAVALRNAAEYLPAADLMDVLHTVRRAREAVSGQQATDRYRVLARAEQVATERLGASSDVNVITEHLEVPQRTWKAGTTLRVRFVNGTRSTHRRVETIARQWSSVANVEFNFLPYPSTGQSDIRVTFAPGATWSYIGTDARLITDPCPTMSIDSESVSNTEQFERAVLKNFGHVLGLIAEHQNPTGGIPWNREAVYRYFTGAPTHWTREQVDTDILRTLVVPGYRRFDPRSVMLIDIAADLTRDGLSYGGGSALSVSDMQFVARLYPSGQSAGPPEEDLGRRGDDLASCISVSVQWPDFDVRSIDMIPFGEHSKIWTLYVNNAGDEPIDNVHAWVGGDGQTITISFGVVPPHAQRWYNIRDQLSMDAAPGATLEFTAYGHPYRLQDEHLSRLQDGSGVPLMWSLQDSRRVAEGIAVWVDRPSEQVRTSDELVEDERWWVVSISNGSYRPIMNVVVVVTNLRNKRALEISFPPVEPGRMHWWVLRPDSGFQESDPAPTAAAEFDALGRRWRLEGGHVEGGDPSGPSFTRPLSKG